MATLYLTSWDRAHRLRVYDPDIPHDGREGQLWADSAADAAGPDEAFELVPVGDAFGLLVHGRFVSVQPDGRIECNRLALGPWERFRWIPGLDGGRAIRSVEWGTILCAEGGGGGIVSTRAYDSPGPWETVFTPNVGTSPTPGLHGPIRRMGPRAIGDDRGTQQFIALSRFYHGSEILQNPGRVAQDVANDVAAGYDAARVLFQVGSLGGGDYWDGHIADPTHPRYEESIRALLDTYRAGGLRIASACLIGKGGGMDRQSTRRDHVRRLAAICRDYHDVIVVAQIMNEPGILGRVTIPELLELEALFRQDAPGLVTSTGADGTEDGPGGYEADSYGVMGTPHLDRDTTKSEMQDRPWRQPWDVGLTGRCWGDDEPIGPGASVASERRPNVLRSHRLVAFIARASFTVFHADEGIRGIGDLTAVPGYRECPRSKLFLPEGGLANGEMQNSNSNFPARHWDLDPSWYRAGNGNTRGIVRCYGNQVGGTQYTVPFGPVTDFELIARYGMRVECYQQDVGEQLWERLVNPGERVRFSVAHPDYLLVSRHL